MINNVAYRIRNISGVTTYHQVRFVNGVRDGWRQTQSLSELLTEIDRSPWITLIGVN